METDMGLKSLKEIQEMLADPDNTYRSAPFWGWNAKLEKQELHRQMQEMKKEKMGGFFIHSREGLETEYLSKEWMDLVRDSVAYAESHGLEAWIYDEDKWPSGSAGGMVSGSDPERFTAKGLTLEVLDGKNARVVEDGDILGIFRQEGKTLVFRQETSGPSEWYNGMAPTDNLNPDAVKTFLQMTHEMYQEACGDAFGKTVKGFFTDEPNFCDFFSVFTKGRPWLPWSGGFAKEFRKRRGYDLLEKLPGLFYDCGDCKKTRHDYWWTLTELFGENYMKQLYDWCSDRQLMLTGHVLYENDLGYGVRVSGGAMPHYQYMHAPGIDILGEQAQEYLTVKQCTSVANQYGREMVVSETYGCTGWGLTFEGQKWLGDWQFVLGVTRRCQHLALYSITGCRKRDYPPVFNYQNTWWKDLHVLEDYFARLAVCTTAGKAVRNVLVIHPLTTIWTKSRSAPWEDLNRVEMNMGWLDENLFGLNREGERYNRLAAALAGMHYDFDFGDEMIMAKEARVESGKFWVKEAAYSVVIVPPVTTLFASTVDKLEEFLRAGGNVIWIGGMTGMIEGAPSRMAGVLRNYEGFCQAEDEEHAYRMLEKVQPRIISLKDPKGCEAGDILTMVRKTVDGYVVFLVNHNREHGVSVRAFFPDCNQIEEYIPLTGKIKKASFYADQNRTRLQIHFSPAESKVFFLKCGKKTEASACGQGPGVLEFPYLHPHRADKVWCVLGPEADISLNMENALTLDTCRVYMGENCLKLLSEEELPVWKAQKLLRETLGMRQIYYNGAPQRYTWVHTPCENGGTAFKLEFEAKVQDVPEGDVFLAVEHPEGLEVSCNGVICPASGDWFLERGIQKFKVSGLTEGTNTLTVSGNYKNDMELEDIYLTGDFGVDVRRYIVKPVRHLYFGDWCLQGLFHYAGDVSYRFLIQEEVPAGARIMLKAGAYKGVLVSVRVNGEEAGVLIGRSCEAMEITPYLKKKVNEITLTVTGSLRNLMGPFHQTYTGCSRLSWEDFRTEGNLYTPQYVTEPYGLMEQIVLSVEEGEGR